MRVEKRILNDALRVLGKVVCQTSPVRNFCLIVRIEACGSRILHNVEVKMRSVKWFFDGLCQKSAEKAHE